MKAITKALEKKLTYPRTKAGGSVNTQDLFDLNTEEIKQMIDAQAKIYNESKRSTDDALESLGISTKVKTTPSSNKRTNTEAEIKLRVLTSVLSIKEENKSKAEKAKVVRERLTQLKEAAMEKDKKAIMEADGTIIDSSISSLMSQLEELERDY